jgi:hypothetical protein
MAKGDYILFNNVPFQSVTANPRRYGVMFNPNSSRSRFRIRDSGKRYAVRLRPDGIVEYSIDGEVNWQTIDPLADPCTGTKLPAMFSHENRRIGEALTNITFDMIAVGRGRIIGKEAGTDRLFHVYVDEIFRTFQMDCNPDEHPLIILPPPRPPRQEDPPVPPFNMKLDPEYFTEDPPTIVVPPEGTRGYSHHPASLRLPIFNELIQLQISDVMLVLERARTWYLKDTRSQLSIVAMEDLGFSDQDLVDVFTEEAIRDILASVKKAAGEMSDNWLANLILSPFFDVDKIAADWHGQIVTQGSGVMVFAAYVALGVLLYGLGQSDAIKSEPGGKLLIDPAKLIAFMSKPVGKPSAQQHIDEATGKFMALISDLMLRARRGALQRYGARSDVNRPNELPPEWTLENRMPTPNQPPSWMPTVVRTTYMRRKGAGKGAWKKFHTATDSFDRVWLAVNADGSLEAFAAKGGFFNAIFHTSQAKPNGDWDGGTWAPFFTGGDTAKKLTYTRNRDGRLEIFRIAGDNRVFHTTQDAPNSGTFGSWQELYSSAHKRISIAAEANLDGRLEVFAVGEDNLVWRTQQTSPGNWSGNWVPAFKSTDTLRDVWMARNADGTLEAIGIDQKNKIKHATQSSPGGAWNPRWDPLYSDNDHLGMLAIGRNADGTLELIGVADDNQSIWRTRQDSPGKWSGSWSPLFQPGDALQELCVATNTQGWLEVVGRSSDNRVWHSWQTAPNGNFNSSLQEIEALRGRTSLAVAPNVDGSIEIIGIEPTEPPDIFTQHVWRMRLLAEKRFAIQYSQALDIGIGSSHWSENWQTHFGGEIHALLAPRPLFQGERYSLTQYRFLNGPVIDGDAFNDGTTNFYMMVKLGPPGASGAGYLQRYAILWFDEQTYFTQRYRLVHPTDDILGDLFSLQHYLRDNPEWYDFHLAKYWCPFRADLINDDSRMVLRRNVIVVTGKDQQRHEIYTIVFNYGLCDHSWRWRLFPQGEHVLVNAAIAQDQDPQLPADVIGGSANAYVVVNTIDIRDDTMLHVRGSLRSPVTQTLRVGRWVQRYLPADCRHVPERHELTGQKPAVGFDHKWDFVSEPAYQRADRFYQFGVYEDLLDSRGQYYEVELLPSAGGTPGVPDVMGRVWANDRLTDGEDRLRMNTINFNWALAWENGAIVKKMQSNNPDELFVHEFRKRESASMYERTARFRILERKPLGLIAVFYDKRDDELQAVSDLPQPTTLRHDTVESSIPDAWKIADGETPLPPLPDPNFPNIRVRFKSNHRVVQPPNVRKAQVVVDNAPGLRLLHVSFWTPQTEQEVCENIWKVSLAAIDQNGAVFPIFSVTRFANFVRRAFPDAPLPSNFTGDLGDVWRYDFDFPFAKEVETDVRRFCTPEGHIEFGTSLWFEDIIGHRALAEELIFA